MVDERSLYRFVDRTIATEGRGILDNALVRVLHERTIPFVAEMVPGLAPDRLALVTDSVHGFVLGVLESWPDTKDRIGADDVVAMVGLVSRAGLRAAGEGAAG